jgi:hypothetical protein
MAVSYASNEENLGVHYAILANTSNQWRPTYGFKTILNANSDYTPQQH